jgi:hypothetical protein
MMAGAAGASPEAVFAPLLLLDLAVVVVLIFMTARPMRRPNAPRQVLAAAESTQAADLSPAESESRAGTV